MTKKSAVLKHSKIHTDATYQLKQWAGACVRACVWLHGQTDRQTQAGDILIFHVNKY